MCFELLYRHNIQFKLQLNIEFVGSCPTRVVAKRIFCALYAEESSLTASSRGRSIMKEREARVSAAKS